MTKYPINSNNILTVGYDEVKQILEIEFKLKVFYHYLDVPMDEFVAFLTAEDVEQFYFDFIQYKYHFDVF